MTPRQEYGRALGLLAAGGVAVLATSAAGWVAVRSVGGVAGLASRDISLSGTALSAALSPLALVALAGVVGVLASRGLSRRIVGGAVFLTGVGLCYLVLATRFGSATLLRALRVAAGDQAATIAAAHWNVAWVATLLGSLLVTLSAGWVVLRGPAWANLSTRYETAAGTTSRPEPKRDDWSRLDRGEDPTTDLTQSGDSPDAEGTL